MTENAVLNANYLAALVGHALDVPNGNRCMHEFVAAAAKRPRERIVAMEIAKRAARFRLSRRRPSTSPEALVSR